MSRSMLAVCLCVAVVVTSTGCPEPEPADRLDRVPATATVTYNGTPVEGATVTLFPKDSGGKGAFGLTDSSGTATLGTYESGDGAVPGEYTVTVFKTEGATSGVVGDAEESDVAEEEEESEEDVEAADLLPVKYKDISTTDLSATVTEGGDNAFVFELKD